MRLHHSIQSAYPISSNISYGKSRTSLPFHTNSSSPSASSFETQPSHIYFSLSSFAFSFPSHAFFSSFSTIKSITLQSNLTSLTCSSIALYTRIPLKSFLRKDTFVVYSPHSSKNLFSLQHRHPHHHHHSYHHHRHHHFTLLNMAMNSDSPAAIAAAVPAILVTGGCGYIGSHTVLEILEGTSYPVVVIDNLCNSSEKSLLRVKQIINSSSSKINGAATLDEITVDERIHFIKVDLLDQQEMEKQVFQRFQFFACIHFAGLKAVGESVKLPINYYHNNLTGTINLLQLMIKYNCKNIVFSSSATVYGLIPQEKMPVDESAPIGATNPYGRTKLFIEDFLRDLHVSDPSWNALILRYFNPVGAHPSGLIGESPSGIPNNLMPYIAQVAVGKREFLSVFGTDYPTPDGTGVRDYIHVVDLAKGHLAALHKLKQQPGCVAVNLGRGKGSSVMEMLRAMEKACGHEIKYKNCPRRQGDIPELYSKTDFAKEFLKWEANLGLDEMCADTWNWQSRNPNGYEDS